MQFRGKRVRWFWPLIWISRLARRKRMQRFADLFHPDESTVICDIGGTWRIWRFLAAKPRVIIINRD